MLHGAQAASLKSLEASLQTVLSSLAKPQGNISATDSPPEPQEEKRRPSGVLLSEGPLVSSRYSEKDLGDPKTTETAAAMLLLHGLPHPSLTPLVSLTINNLCVMLNPLFLHADSVFWRSENLPTMRRVR